MNVILGVLGILVILLPGSALIIVVDVFMLGRSFQPSLIPVSIFLSVPITLLILLITKRIPFIHQPVCTLLSKLLPD